MCWPAVFLYHMGECVALDLLVQFVALSLHTHADTHTHAHTHTLTHTHTLSHSHTQRHAHTHTRTHTCRDYMDSVLFGKSIQSTTRSVNKKWTHTHTFIHIHTHTHTFIHIHTHLCTPLPLQYSINVSGRGHRRYVTCITFWQSCPQQNLECMVKDIHMHTQRVCLFMCQ